MDYNRSENRDVNHHGKSVAVEESLTPVVSLAETRNSDLIARRENVQIDALKKMYREAKVKEKNL